MKYHRIGIPTAERFAGEIDLPHLKVTVSDHAPVEPMKIDRSSAEISTARGESPANTRGLALREELNHSRRCYYWWFQDTGHDDFAPLRDCPACGLPLVARGSKLVCEPCGIMAAN